MQITDNMQQSLLSTTKWTKFLAIVATVGMVFLIILALFMMISFPFNSVIPGMGGVIGLIYLVIVALYAYPLIQAFKFVSSTRESITQQNESKMEEGLCSLKSIVHYFGILTIIVLSLYALIFLFAIAAAVFM